MLSGSDAQVRKMVNVTKAQVPSVLWSCVLDVAIEGHVSVHVIGTIVLLYQSSTPLTLMHAYSRTHCQRSTAQK